MFKPINAKIYKVVGSFNLHMKSHKKIKIEKPNRFYQNKM